MKKIISTMLALILVITSISFNHTYNVDAEQTDWQTTAITAPAKDSLVGAGYINIVFSMELDNAKEYKVYFNNELKGTFKADSSVKTMTCEVYTTKVSAHTAYVVATLNDDSTLQTATTTFYVSKKGLAMGGDMSSTVEMKKLNLSWYYNWGTTAFKNSVDDGVIHVPMVWGASEENIADLVNITDDSNYVLGFNEPDIASQANLKPIEGIKAWPMIEALGKRTVSPAAANPNGASSWVTSFLNGTYDEDGTFVEGVECDAVALHCYGANTNIDNLIRAVDSMWNAYHKPIWVTEVSVMGRKGTSYDHSYENIKARKEVEEYIRKVVKELDSREYVERYAWFPYNINSKNEIDDMDGAGASAMFDYDTGKFTELGCIYSSIGNPEGYNVVKITDEEKYEQPTTAAPTTVAPTTKVTPTTKVEPTTKAVIKRPSKVSLYKPKNVKKKSVKLVWKKAKNAKKYQVQYSLNKKFRKNKKFKTRTKFTKKMNIKISKLTKKKTYYFRVRGINGKIAGKWSIPKRVKVNK